MKKVLIKFKTTKSKKEIFWPKIYGITRISQNIIAQSILYLCRHKDNIDNFNKKAIYIMIREMTDVKTSKITQITNTFRKIYPKIQEEVLTRGHIDNLRYTGSLV